MKLQLSPHDMEMLNGQEGPAVKFAMKIVVRMAEVAEAESLLDITAAHIDSTIYIGEAGLEFAEHLAGLNARVKVPTSLNVSGVDEHHWQEWAVPPDWAYKAQRQMKAYQSMGTVPTWTCAPYQTEMRPVFGQQIAWGESNAIVFANSVIGARTERYPDLFDICCAITGRAPASGLHITENRRGQLLFRLANIPLSVQQSEEFYPALGHFLGKIAQDRIPVIDGLTVQPDEDRLKALGAASASSGAVALFHMVGVTPEAPSLEAAFHGGTPPAAIEISMQTLRQARQELTHAESDRLDMVVLGSPHFSLAEFRRLALFLEGQKQHSQVKFLVTSNRVMVAAAENAGFLEPLRNFGGQIMVDTCILATPMLPPEIQNLMTNSAKFAYYTPGLLGRQMTFGSLEDCIRSAVAGKVLRNEAAWND
jgi:cis-L-3-hydroxyproline dehydratase